MSGIVWLASYPKSGNTWLRAFLANIFSGSDQPFDINRLSDFTFSDMRANYFEKVAQRPIAELSEMELNRLRPQVHRHLANRTPHTILVKTHHSIGMIHDIPTITRDVTAGAVYLVRNPLDVVISYANHMAKDIDATIRVMNDRASISLTTGWIVVQYVSSWSAHVKSWTTAPGLTHHVMRYEDMHDSTTETFRELIEFLTIETTEEQLQRAIRFASFGELQKQEQTKGFRERSQVSEAFFRQGQHGAWRHVLSAAQVDAIVGAHGEMMAKYGYLP